MVKKDVKETKNVAKKVEATEPKTKKEPRILSAGEAKTDAFKQHLQVMIKDRLDVKVSKETAWSMFKDFMHGTQQFVVSQEDKRLPLAGVGSFEVISIRARGKKKEETGLDTLAKFRFYPSSTMHTATDYYMGVSELPEDLVGLGLYNMEDPHTHFAPQQEINKTWLSEQRVDEEE